MFKFGTVKIDPMELGSRGNAVLGIRDSGKTYTATLLAERLFQAGIPFLAFDPIGVWRYLRVPGAGRGYPVVVAGGQDGDLPLTVAGAPELARAAMAQGVSLVIDLFDINLTKADWKRIVTAVVRVLLHENGRHGLRHVFIEEAAEFAPQRVGPDQGQVYAEIEKLARMGGNARLGYTLINQRAEEVNKAVLELCDNLFLHRQKGRNSLTALSKWLDIGAVRDHRDIVDSLSTLPTGECWAWLGGTERPIRVKVPRKDSFHPDRRVMRGAVETGTRPAVDVAGFVETMRSSLKTIEVEAKANDPGELKKRIAALERELAAARRATPAPARVEVPVLDAGQIAAMAQLGAELAAAGQRIEALQTRLASIERPGTVATPTVATTTLNVGGPRAAARATTPADQPRQRLQPAGPRHGSNGHQVLPPGELATLRALAQYPDGLRREQLTVLTQYKRSSRDSYIARLMQRGFAESVGGGAVRATEAGVIALGDAFEPLPTGAALREHWLARLPEGERSVLATLIAAYPSALERDAIDEATGYRRSSRDSYLARLAAKQLVVQAGRGMVKASGTLFEVLYG